jgi:hypothetical protein
VHEISVSLVFRSTVAVRADMIKSVISMYSSTGSNNIDRSRGIKVGPLERVLVITSAYCTNKDVSTSWVITGRNSAVDFHVNSTDNSIYSAYNILVNATHGGVVPEAATG